MRGGSELGEESLVGRCLGDQDEPKEILLGTCHGSGSPPRTSNSVAADVGSPVHTDPGVDRPNGQHPTRYLDLSAGGLRHRNAGNVFHFYFDSLSIVCEISKNKVFFSGSR